MFAASGSICLKDYVEAATIAFLFTIAEWLESRASHKNFLAVKAGEAIPIDGIVVEGECEVHEKALTAESFPVPKLKHSTVWAGTVNLNGYITVKTTALAEDCAVARMAMLVEEAQNKKSSTQRVIDKWAKYYTPAVFLISICVAVVPVALRVHNQSHWFHFALVILVSGCPCTLILSTPVATFCALSKAATTGLLTKGGDYIEILAKTKIIAFEKTSTITRGEFTVTDFQSLHDDISFNTLLYWFSSIESKSSHPMAAALVDYGRSHSVEAMPEAVEEFHNFPGEGVHGRIDGRDVNIGNKRIAQRAGYKADLTAASKNKEPNTVGYIFSGATLVGKFNLSDCCRTGVAEAMKELKRMGIRTAMLTGDSQTSAATAQNQLGHALEEVHAELLPEDKARLIEGFKKEGTTTMVGDGINDAPALATADIGISMGITGSALATETGHVILMSNDIRKIPKAVQLSRKCNRKVFENVIIAVSTKAAIIALAISGWPLVWAAVLADVGTCMLVILNSMLLLRGTHQHGGKCCRTKSKRTHQHQHQHGFDSCSSGPSTCDSKKCRSSIESQDRTSNGDAIHHEEKSCENNCCHSLPQKHVDCEEVCGVHEEKHKHGSSGCCSTITHDHGASHGGENHSSHKHISSRADHKLVSGSHDKTVHCQKNQVKKNPDGSSCGFLSEKRGACCEKKSHEKHHKAFSEKDETSLNYTELPPMEACISLEKRELGGCCKRYRKECCGHKQGHFGTPFATGLSEIIIE